MEVDAEQVDVRVADEYTVGAVLGSSIDGVTTYPVAALTKALLDEQHQYEHCYVDPRLPELGSRFICSSSHPVTVQNDTVYELARIALGVAEHPDDTPPGGCLPLECNLDQLHAINWRKVKEPPTLRCTLMSP